MPTELGHAKQDDLSGHFPGESGEHVAPLVRMLVAASQLAQPAPGSALDGARVHDTELSLTVADIAMELTPAVLEMEHEPAMLEAEPVTASLPLEPEGAPPDDEPISDLNLPGYEPPPEVEPEEDESSATVQPKRGSRNPVPASLTATDTGMLMMEAIPTPVRDRLTTEELRLDDDSHLRVGMDLSEKQTHKIPTRAGFERPLTPEPGLRDTVNFYNQTQSLKERQSRQQLSGTVPLVPRQPEYEDPSATEPLQRLPTIPVHDAPTIDVLAPEAVEELTATEHRVYQPRGKHRDTEAMAPPVQEAIPAPAPPGLKPEPAPVAQHTAAVPLRRPGQPVTQPLPALDTVTMKVAKPPDAPRQRDSARVAPPPEPALLQEARTLVQDAQALAQRLRTGTSQRVAPAVPPDDDRATRLVTPVEVEAAAVRPTRPVDESRQPMFEPAHDDTPEGEEVSHTGDTKTVILERPTVHVADEMEASERETVRARPAPAPDIDRVPTRAISEIVAAIETKLGGAAPLSELLKDASRRITRRAEAASPPEPAAAGPTEPRPATTQLEDPYAEMDVDQLVAASAALRAIVEAEVAEPAAAAPLAQSARVVAASPLANDLDRMWKELSARKSAVLPRAETAAIRRTREVGLGWTQGELWKTLAGLTMVAFVLGAFFVFVVYMLFS